MEELINKIKTYTQDGPPGVGQRIELADIAKKSGVRNVELEKLINKFIAENKKPESSISQENQELDSEDSKEETDENPFERPVRENYRMNEYERPDMDSARDSFEKELQLRQQLEQEKIDASATEFEQPDIVFPELNVTFGNEEPVDDAPKLEEIEIPEIVQEDLVSAFEVPEVPVSQVEIITDDDKPIPEPTINTTENSITFEPEVEQPEQEIVEDEDDFSLYENGEEIPSFEDKINDTQERLDKEDILRKIIAENKKAKEEAERSANSKKKSTSKSSQSKYSSPKSNVVTVTLEQSKAAKVTGIVSIVAAILPFFFIGLIAGVYGYSVAKKHKENIESNPNIYGSTITKNVNLGYFLSMGGAVLGGIRLFTAFF